MDKNNVNMYIMNNSKYFPADKIEFVRGKIASMNEDQYMAIASIELKDPSTMLLVSIFGGGLGIDRFMLGDVGKGILKLILTGGCIGLIWWIIDITSIKERTCELNFNNFMKQVSMLMNTQMFSSQGEQTSHEPSVSNSSVNTIALSNQQINTVSPAPETPQAPVKTHEPAVSNQQINTVSPAPAVKTHEPAVSNQQINTVSPAPETPQASVKTYEPIVGLDTDVLVKRAFLFLEDDNFSEADRYLEQALNQDPENSRAYLGKLMVEKRVHNTDELVKLAQPLDDNKFFKRALRFANDEEKANLQAYAEASRSV